jgi:hypothetical protein
MLRRLEECIDSTLRTVSESSCRDDDDDCLTRIASIFVFRSLLSQTCLLAVLDFQFHCYRLMRYVSASSCSHLFTPSVMGD